MAQVTQIGKLIVRWIGAGAAGIACLAAVSTAWADPYIPYFIAPFTPEHTAYGVSQLLAGPIPGGDRLKGENDNFLSITLSNPNSVDQVAVVLIYERKDTSQNLGRPEKFLGCFAKKLTPHASHGVGNQQVKRGILNCPATGDCPDLAEVPWYAEVLTIPRKPVLRTGATGYVDCGFPIQPRATTCTGAADGLGIIAEAGTSIPLFDEATSENGVIHQGHLQVLYPGMFTLPDPFEGTAQAGLAAQCICEKGAEAAGDPFARRAYNAFFDTQAFSPCVRETTCNADQAHSVCVVGTKLNGVPQPADNPACSTCAFKVCQRDPYCCNVAWDAKCVAEVSKFCDARDQCTR